MKATSNDISHCTLNHNYDERQKAQNYRLERCVDFDVFPIQTMSYYITPSRPSSYSPTMAQEKVCNVHESSST